MILEPESNPELNVLVVSADIIDALRKDTSGVVVDLLMRKFLSKDIRRTPELFFDSLTFLYLVGIIDEESSRLKIVGVR